MPADRSLPRPEEKRHWSYSATLANPPFSIKTLNGQRFYLMGSLASLGYGIYSTRKAAYLYLFSTAIHEEKKNEIAAKGALDSYERSVAPQMYRKIGLRGAAFLLLPFVFCAIPVRYRFLHKNKDHPAKIVQEHVH